MHNGIRTEPNFGWVFGVSRVGHNHLIANTQGQDCCAIWSGRNAKTHCLALAIADGHGDVKHDLSHRGSRIAVDSAIEEMKGLFEHSLDGGNVGRKSSLSAMFKAGFPKSVLRRWRQNVEEDFRVRNSCSKLNENSDEASMDLPQILSRYGSTLLAVMLIDDLLLMSQIGDGDIYFLRKSGSIVRPIESPKEQVGNATYSLSSHSEARDAELLVQTAGMRILDGDTLVVATDGFANALDDVQIERFLTGLVDQINESGLERVVDDLPQWLDGYSEYGSGDDITLGAIGVRKLKTAPLENGKQRRKYSKGSEKEIR